ncbi:hypothetical protein Pla52n_33690 [Stieleria varia]|uniref:Uncharacterized protein n=1 Tax=Stieleria varia TaxID=2528005 RepID=A0A5C6ASR2_9BACT|nr:hypothetical protein Pla52n_33690 [Stieleria varia]
MSNGNSSNPYEASTQRTNDRSKVAHGLMVLTFGFFLFLVACYCAYLLLFFFQSDDRKNAYQILIGIWFFSAISVPFVAMHGYFIYRNFTHFGLAGKVLAITEVSSIPMVAVLSVLASYVRS